MRTVIDDRLVRVRKYGHRGTRMRGVTLTELMLTLAIAGILAAFAIPAFSDIILNNRRASLVNEVLVAMQYARSEALKRGQPVTVCASTNQTTCSGAATDFATGWIVFIDYNCSTDTVANTNCGTIEGGTPADEIIRVAINDFAPSVLSVVSTQAAYWFRPFNRDSQEGRVMVCDQRAADDESTARFIFVARNGRTRVASGLGTLTCPI